MFEEVLSAPDTQSSENIVDVVERREWPEKPQLKKSREIAKRITPADERDIDELIPKTKITIKIDDRFTVKAKHYIGSVDFQDAGFKLNVLPKIFQHDEDKNKKTAAVIDFANGLSLEDIMESQENYYKHDIEPLLNDVLYQQLVRDADYLHRRGLLRSYVLHTENMTSLRGKLLFQYQMLNDVRRNPKFFCEYDELEYDNAENRTILQALTVVRRVKRKNIGLSDRQKEWRDKIKNESGTLAEHFSEVVQKKEVSRPERLQLMQNHTRQNYYYKNVLRVSNQIIDSMGISDIYRGGAAHVMAFLTNMDKIYEKFVQRLFEEYYVHPKQVNRQIPRDAWKTNEFTDKKMYPDIIIRDGNVVKKIIDAKHKPKIEVSDLYQLGFYMHEYSLVDQAENDEGIEESFAILPRYKDHEKIWHEKEGSYEAAMTEKKVHVKRLDVNDCVKEIRDGNVGRLEAIVKKLTD